MKRSTRYIVTCTVCAAAAWAGLLLLNLPDPRIEKILAAYQPGTDYDGVTIDAPFAGTVFPPDLAAPLFKWSTDAKAANTWLLLFQFAADGQRASFVSQAQEWRPAPAQWKRIRNACSNKPATVTVLGVSASAPGRVLCSASLSFQISPDPVSAPIFFREVNLPFSEAVKDPSRIRWRLGAVSSEKPPPVVLDHLPVCGNCHSFSRDASVLGMDVDYANDKGSYVIADVAPEITLTKDKLITWSAYRSGDGRQTFGLLSQVSPDGRYVISTVKDRSVFLAMPKLEYSQLFFPIQGILAVYDRRTGEFKSLPGADDPEFVQSNPAWSPDGKTVVFARNKAYRLKNPVRTDAVLLRQDECNEFLKGGMTFLYDLYRIPFNDGKGGVAEPLQGASRNGKSNYFPKFSPDGKWLVFCQAASFMLLQPDSELFILPADGGDARRLACNQSRMNSWHSWSPNGRWLVFSSKPGTPFTRLFLSHIDEQGMSSPAVLLDSFTAPNRAANIPEFVDLKTGGLRAIRERFIDEASYVRAGNAFRDGGEFGNAVAQYRKALELSPGNVEALVNLGSTLSDMNELQEAVACLGKALEKSPANAVAFYNLGVINAKRGDFDEAIRCCGEAVKLDPASANAQSNLAIFLLEKGRLDEALGHLSEAIRLDPKKDNAHFALGRIMVRKGQLAEAARCYAEALKIAPDERYLNALAWILATAPDPSLRDGKRSVELASRLCELTRFQSARALDILGAGYAEAGQFQPAIEAATRALDCALKQGNQRLASEIAVRRDMYRQNKAIHQ